MNYFLLFVAAMIFSLTSCGHIFTKNHSYTKSSAVTVNGAQVGSAVKPEGGKGGFSISAMVYMAASATLDGPFRWRIEAEGQEGFHESLTVHRVKVITSKTKRSEWFPRAYLGKAEPFKPYKKTPGKSYANFEFPGKLKVYPREDGDITVIVDVSVKTTEKEERRQLKFQLKSGTTKEVDFFNIPAEIIKSSQKDPREWKWGKWANG